MPPWFDRHRVEQCIHLLVDGSNVRDPGLVQRAMTEYDQIFSKYVPSQCSVLNTSEKTIVPTLAAVLFVDAVDDTVRANYTPLHSKRRRRMMGALENDVYYILSDNNLKLYRFATVYAECAGLNPT